MIAALGRRLDAAAAGIAALSPRRRAGLAFAAGIGSAFAMPPLSAWPVLVVALPVLVWCLDGCRTVRGAAFVGWSFAFGQFLAGLFWIAWALTVDLATWWWALPFAMAGLPAALALFPALCLAPWARWRPVGIGRPMLLAAALGLSEFLRGHLLTGFPWNLTGYVWSGSLATLQIVAPAGIYALGLITLLAAAGPAAWRSGGRWSRSGIVLSACAAGALALGTGWGAARLAGSGPVPTVEDVRLRLVQPNISQADKWRSDLLLDHFRDHLALSGQPGPATHIIWSETAVAYDPTTQPTVRDAIARAIPDGATLITGAPRVTRDGDRVTGFWNSLVALSGATGEVLGLYDKAHLVPFGEYQPLPDWLGIGTVAAAGSFSAGPGPQTLRLPGAPPVSPLICYEVIFPGRVVDPTDRPGWLLNLTNDAWYGYTPGPFQHFAVARVRAVEEGLPLVRVAGTGVSGVIDPYGRVTARLGLSARGVLDADLPQALPDRPVPTAVHTAVFWTLLAALLAMAARRRGAADPA